MALPRQLQQESEQYEAQRKTFEEKQSSEGEPAPATPNEVTGEASPTEPADTPTLESLTEDVRLWKAKFESEVPRMQKYVKEKDDENESLRSELSETQAQLAELTEQVRSFTQARESEQFDTEVSEVLDEETRKVVERIAERRAQELLEANNANRGEDPSVELRQRIDSIESQTRVDAENQAYALLAQQVPDWRTINDDPRFHAWLRDAEPLSRQTRQQALDEAWQALDVPYMVDLFKSFIGGGVIPPATPISPEPGMGGTPAEPVLAVSEAEYEQAALDLTKGRLTPAQFKPIEQRYLQGVLSARAEQGQPVPRV